MLGTARPVCSDPAPPCICLLSSSWGPGRAGTFGQQLRGLTLTLGSVPLLLNSAQAQGRVQAGHQLRGREALSAQALRGPREQAQAAPRAWAPLVLSPCSAAWLGSSEDNVGLGATKGLFSLVHPHLAP